MKAALAAKPADEVPLPPEAVETLKKFPEKFDQTVEIHIRLGIDPKQYQIVRGPLFFLMALVNQNVLLFLPKEILLMMQPLLERRKLVVTT